MTQDYNQSDQTNGVIFSSLVPAAFGSNKDFVSDVININDNYAYIFSVTEITKSLPLNVNSIQEILLEDWKKSMKTQKRPW